MADQDEGRGLYAISVVADLLGTGQQNIRLYERRGLLTPGRTSGGTRQYSDSDLAVLRRIGELLDEGLNLAGVAKVLELEVDNARLRRQLERARPATPGSWTHIRPPASRNDSSNSSASSPSSSRDSRIRTSWGDRS